MRSCVFGEGILVPVSHSETAWRVHRTLSATHCKGTSLHSRHSRKAGANLLSGDCFILTPYATGTNSQQKVLTRWRGRGIEEHGESSNDIIQGQVRFDATGLVPKAWADMGQPQAPEERRTGLPVHGMRSGWARGDPVKW
jgi:hypothetical protein